jgi:hypothetical protein
MNLSTKVSIIALLVLFTSGAAVAGDKTVPDFKGSDGFKKAFPHATVVSFEVKQKYTVVNFTWNNLQLQAFYDRQGNAIGTSRTIDPKSLPLSCQANISDQYPGYVMTEAIEFDHVAEGLNYYVTIEGKERSYVLQISSEGTISVFKKMKK